MWGRSWFSTTDILNNYYYSTHRDTAQIWSWRTQCRSPAHNRYPAIYVVLVCRGEKWQSAFKKKAKTLITVFYTEHKEDKTSLLLRIVMVSAKTFSAYLSVYELANYSSAKTFDICFARLLDCPIF